MAYREPGVYSTAVNARRQTFNGVQMLPCIIGPGARKLTDVVSIIRGEAATGDELPYEKVSKVNKISDYEGGPGAYVLTEDFTLSNTGGKSQIKWVTDKGPNIGAPYYVDLVYEVEDTQYELNLVQSRETAKIIYGTDIRSEEDGEPINLLATAVNIAFENGSPGVYVLQIKTQAETPTKDEFIKGLDLLSEEENIWRIVPTVLTDEIIHAITEHIRVNCSYEERKERTAFLSVPYTSSRPRPTAFDGTDGLLNVVGGFAEGMKYKREVICYPDVYLREFSDGKKRELGPQMAMAALAGAEQTQIASKSRTRTNITGFHSTSGLKMKRVQTNQLAGKGILIFQQASTGQLLSVRHQLTTDMSSVQTREMSIVAIEDYCSKSFRFALEQYIGTDNINNELLSMIDGTLKIKIAEATKLGYINGGSVTFVLQDADSPDTIVTSVRVNVPYPCNYIDIVMYLE